MALLTINLYSKLLCVTTQVSVLLPRIPQEADPAAFYGSGERFKALWLLHGSGGDHTDWLQNSSIARYAEERSLAVIMPSVLNSDYANYPTFADGFPVWDYIAQELMPMVYGWLPVAKAREDNYIAGISMGGNGALMLALGYPSRFDAVAVLSSTAREVDYLRPAAAMTSAQFRAAASDVQRFPGPNGSGMRTKEVNAVAKYATVGEYLASPENAWDRMAEMAAKGDMPRLYCSCGTADVNVYPRFLRFRDYAQRLGVQATFREIAGLRHEWALWDVEIQKALEFFLHSR